MTRDEAIAILTMSQEEAIVYILSLAEKAEKYDQLFNDPSPTTPSGMTPTYLKPVIKKRSKKPGRKKGHQGTTRKIPDIISKKADHTLEKCPHCHTDLNKPVKNYKRYIEDISPLNTPEVTEHTVNGYWCSHCKKVVYPTVTEALPNSNIGLRLIVTTAWLHYLIGISLSNILNILNAVTNFKISRGGLTQAWVNLANTLEPVYNTIIKDISNSAVLNADETGWRINGRTHWLWCFTTNKQCYYLIDRKRGSPVVKKVLGIIYKGILICDFWSAYNKIKTLAKQRCFYHLFTELVKVDKHNFSSNWKAFRKKLSRLLKDAIRLSEKKSQLEKNHYENLKQKLYKRLDQLLTNTYEDKDAKRLIKRLKRHRNELFTFLSFDNVSPYNNHAEQQMRKPVITRKISQQNRSDQGAKAQAILMTLFRSAELQGLNPIKVVLNNTKKAIDSSISLGESDSLVA